ncbi:hypothetical protein NKI46_05335 [Mesorhizobium sp. M0615]|uniref:hypothetical protein n=1 Tax=Mesorhizobium sp. M0615 TaxID=2956971 RepID=UPI0033381880
MMHRALRLACLAVSFLVKHGAAGAPVIGNRRAGREQALGKATPEFREIVGHQEFAVGERTAKRDEIADLPGQRVVGVLGPKLLVERPLAAPEPGEVFKVLWPR